MIGIVTWDIGDKFMAYGREFTILSKDKNGVSTRRKPIGAKGEPTIGELGSFSWDDMKNHARKIAPNPKHFQDTDPE